MEKRVYNFSPGPAVLPLPALEEAQRDLVALPGTGISILEISHRSKAFDKIITQAEANIRTLLAVPDNYRVLFLQGGALLQFGMIPMNFLRGHRQDGRLHRQRHLEQKGLRRSENPRQRPGDLGWKVHQFQPRAQAIGIEDRSRCRLRLHDVRTRPSKACSIRPSRT